MVEIKLDSAGIERIIEGMKGATAKSQQFFEILGNELHQMTMLTFQAQGARSGHPAWKSWNDGKGFNVLGGTTITDIGTRKIRYGSDKIPKRNRQEIAEYRSQLMKSGKWGYGWIGYMPGYQGERRYTGQDMLLQASGAFKRSFGIKSVNPQGVVYGTYYRSSDNKTDAAKIIGDREVLFLMPQDYQKIRTDFLTFIRRGIQF